MELVFSDGLSPLLTRKDGSGVLVAAESVIKIEGIITELGCVDSVRINDTILPLVDGRFVGYEYVKGYTGVEIELQCGDQPPSKIDYEVVGPDDLKLAGMDVHVPPIRLGQEFLPVCVGLFVDGFGLPLELNEAQITVDGPAVVVEPGLFRAAALGEVTVTCARGDHSQTVAREIQPGLPVATVVAVLTGAEAVAGDIVEYSCTALDATGGTVPEVTWMQPSAGAETIGGDRFAVRTARAGSIELTCETSGVNDADVGRALVTIRPDAEAELRTTLQQESPYQDGDEPVAFRAEWLDRFGNVVRGGAADVELSRVENGTRTPVGPPILFGDWSGQFEGLGPGGDFEFEPPPGVGEGVGDVSDEGLIRFDPPMLRIPVDLAERSVCRRDGIRVDSAEPNWIDFERAIESVVLEAVHVANDGVRTEYTALDTSFALDHNRVTWTPLSFLTTRGARWPGGWLSVTAIARPAAQYENELFVVTCTVEMVTLQTREETDRVRFASSYVSNLLGDAGAFPQDDLASLVQESLAGGGYGSAIVDAAMSEDDPSAVHLSIENVFLNPSASACGIVSDERIRPIEGCNPSIRSPGNGTYQPLQAVNALVPFVLPLTPEAVDDLPESEYACGAGQDEFVFGAEFGTVSMMVDTPTASNVMRFVAEDLRVGGWLGGPLNFDGLYELSGSLASCADRRVKLPSLYPRASDISWRNPNVSRGVRRRLVDMRRNSDSVKQHLYNTMTPAIARVVSQVRSEQEREWSRVINRPALLPSLAQLGLAAGDGQPVSVLADRAFSSTRTFVDRSPTIRSQTVALRFLGSGPFGPRSALSDAQYVLPVSLANLWLYYWWGSHMGEFELDLSARPERFENVHSFLPTNTTLSFFMAGSPTIETIGGDLLLATMPSVYVRVVTNDRTDEEAFISLTTTRVFRMNPINRAFGLIGAEFTEQPAHPLNDVRWSILSTNATADYVARHGLGSWERYEDGPDEVLNISLLSNAVRPFIDELTDILLNSVMENAAVPSIDRVDVLTSPGIAETAQFGLVVVNELAETGSYAADGAIVLEAAFMRLGGQCQADEDCVCDGADCAYITGTCGTDRWCELRDVP